MSYRSPRVAAASEYRVPHVVIGATSDFCAAVEMVMPVMGLSVKEFQVPFPQCVLAAMTSAAMVVPSVAVSKSMYIEAVSLRVIVMVADAARVLSLTDVAVSATVAGAGGPARGGWGGAG